MEAARNPLSNKICLWSPLPPAEVAARLAAVMAPEPTGIQFGANRVSGHPLIGQVAGGSVQLRRSIDPYRNSFQTYLTADFERSGAGTLLVGEIGLHPATWETMIVYFVGVVLFGLFGAVMAALPMLVLGGCVAIAGRYNARGEKAFIVDFLAHTLDTQEILGG